jgi:hypothetical protein
MIQKNPESGFALGCHGNTLGNFCRDSLLALRAALALQESSAILRVFENQVNAPPQKKGVSRFLSAELPITIARA